MEQVECGQEYLQCATVRLTAIILCFYHFLQINPVIPLSRGSIAIANNSILSLAAIEKGSSALTCHTELTTCCKTQDNSGSTALGGWRGPNGGSIPDSNTNGFYVSRGMSFISLNYAEGSSEVAGTYCCLVPRESGANTTHCVMVTGECG